MSLNLNQEELEILNSYENETWQSVAEPSVVQHYKEAAKQTLVFITLYKYVTGR